MRTTLFLLVGTACLWSLPPVVVAQILPPRDDTPLLRIDAGGPVSFVSTVAWASSPESQHPVLYAAGWDQVVHAWRLEDARWQYQPASVLRIPVGPGLEVAINSIDVSLDGRRVAIAGRGLMRSSSATRVPGLIWPIHSLGPDDQLDIGLIYVFDREDGSVRILRGHSGAVSHVKFSRAGNRHLVSYAQHDRQGTPVGNLRVWDVDAGEAGAVLAEQQEHVPAPGVMTGLDVTNMAPGIEGMRVALANGTADLLLWDVGQNQLSRTPFGPHAYAATWLAPDRLVSGVVGQLGVWSIPAGPIPKLAQQQNFAGRMALPARTTAFTSATGGKLLASVIGGGAGLELHAYDAATLQRTGVRPLWSSSKAPSLAVDPQGEWIAVAGNDDHSIHVYDVRESRNLSAAPHVLRGAGETFSRVEFCHNGDELGLRLTPTRSSTGERVLDLKSSRLGPAAGWTLSPGTWPISWPGRKLFPTDRRASRLCRPIEPSGGNRGTARSTAAEQGGGRSPRMRWRQ